MDGNHSDSFDWDAVLDSYSITDDMQAWDEPFGSLPNGEQPDSQHALSSTFIKGKVGHFRPHFDLIKHCDETIDDIVFHIFAVKVTQYPRKKWMVRVNMWLLNGNRSLCSS